MYSIFNHGLMISNQPRMDAYAAALRQSVKPGSIVLDIGSGTGIFAMLACKFGAAKVYALEPSSEIELAMELAEDNGFSDRIEFIQDLSTKVTLPEKADVIVSDIRGKLPIFQHAIPSIIDARERHLAPSGKMIPGLDSLWVGLVKNREIYSKHVDAWESDPYGLRLGRAKNYAVNTWASAQLTPDQMMLEPKCWATLDYSQIESPDVNGQVEWSVTEAETAYGLGFWFDTKLDEAFGFSGDPSQPKTIYGHLFAPWTEPVDLRPGDTICADISANFFGNDYIWAWNTQVFANGDSDDVKADFEQCSLMGQPLVLPALEKVAAN